MTVPSTTPATADAAAIAFNLEQLLQIACFNSRVPIALLILHQPSVYRIVSQVGWSLERSLESLAEPLFLAVQASASPPLSVVQEPPEFHSLLTEKLAAFSPPFQFWAGILVQTPADQPQGALVVLDTVAHHLLPQQIDTLRLVAQTLSPYLADGGSTRPTPEWAAGASGMVAGPHVTVASKPATTATRQAEVSQLREENRRLQLLQNLSVSLQGCETLDAVYASLPGLLKPFHSDMCGQVILTHLQQDQQVLKTIRWGDLAEALPDPSLSSDCPVLRSHHPCHCNAGQVISPDCAAFSVASLAASPSSAPHRFCAPIASLKGEIFGILSFSYPITRAAISEADQRLMVAIAQHIALTIERLQRLATLQNQSIRDPLTGLFNRLYLKEMLPQLFNRAEHNHHSICVIMMDIDHFKRFNDQYGHQAGDQVLRDFSLFLKGFIRATDLACRYGGEEFILIVPEVDWVKGQQIANRIRQGLQYVTMRFAGRDLGHITLSAGVAAFPLHGNTDEAVIAAADAALYRSKTDGRNRVSVA